VLGGARLSGETHVLAVVCVGETVLQQTVDELLVAELGAVAHVGEVVRDVGHALGTASDDNLSVAAHDGLGSEGDGLDRRGADLVDGGGHGGLGEASLDGALSGGVLAYIGLEDVAEEDLLDLFGLDAGALDGVLDCVCTELGGGLAGERAQEHARGRTDGRDNVDGGLRGHGDCAGVRVGKGGGIVELIEQFWFSKSECWRRWWCCKVPYGSSGIG
jgi:hypothetical protein